MSESRSSPEQTPGPGRSAAAEARRQKVEKQLDEALADSFPASDPVSIVTSHEEEDWGDG
ncbi:MAG: hypothetical protein ACRETZ_17840 [Steroidobacteraceae bacterium]